MAEKREGTNLAGAMTSMATESFVLNKVQSVRNEIPAASNDLPKEAGTAAAGDATEFSRGDHVHPAETEVVEYRIPDDCFPVTYAGENTSYSIASNDGLRFQDAALGIEMYAYDASASGGYGDLLCFFNTTTLKYSQGNATGLQFNGTAPTANTWPVLEKDTVFVRNVEVATAAKVAEELDGKLSTSGGTIYLPDHCQIKFEEVAGEPQITLLAVNTSLGIAPYAFYKNNATIRLPSSSGTLALAEDLMQSVTWSELKTKKENGTLTPGAFYRITDYVATTTQPNSQSAGHQFDLIVMADSSNKLNEAAQAIQHAGDTYFNSCNLSAWRLRYCLDNDANRFGWADTTNGKGVIYHMVDEFGNEAPYDFKNMQFLAYGDTDNVYRYTFDSGDASGNTDCSIVQSALVVGNKISDYISSQSYNLGKRYLNSIVFKGTRCHNNVLGPDCRFMTFGTGCCYNTFGTECINNIFGGGCAENTFGRGCSGNRFISDVENTVLGEECIANTIGTYSTGTIFGDRCTGNSIGFDCQGNSFDCDCEDNIIGDSSYYNTFGKCCFRNAIAGGYCEGNSFGSHCAENILLGGNLSNSFGDGCRNNAMGSGCNFNTFGNNCLNNTFGSALVAGTFDYQDTYAANIYLLHEGAVYRVTGPYKGKFNSRTSYAVGDYVNNGGYYRCIQAHSSGVWNENQFEQVTLIGDILSDGTSILGARYEQIIYENGVNCTVLNCTATLGNGETYRNVMVRSGVQGTSTDTPKVITDSNKNQTFNTTYKPANSQEISI